MSNSTQKLVARTIHLLDPKRIKLVTEKDSPIYDERVEEALSDATLAKWRLGDIYVPPVTVITPENAALIGYPIDPAEYDALIWAGRQRVRYAVASDTALIEAHFRTAPDMDTYNMESVEENTHRLEMTFEQQVAKARRFYEAGITDVARLASCFNKAESTVKTWLNIAEKAEQVPALKAALDAGEMNVGLANQIANEPTPVVEQVMQEVVKVQMAALQKAAETGKTEGRVSTPVGNATIETNDKGEKIAVPSQDTVQGIKAKVKGKKAPESIKKEAERKAPVALDAALVGSHKARIAMLRRLPGHSPDFIAGAEALAALLTGSSYELPADASDAVKAAHAFLFAKAE